MVWSFAYAILGLWSFSAGHGNEVGAATVRNDATAVNAEHEKIQPGSASCAQ